MCFQRKSSCSQGVLNPARAQNLAGQVFGELQDLQPRHQPRRQSRMAGPKAVAFAKPRRQMPPIDRAGQHRLRVTPVDDLIEPRTKHVVLTRFQCFTRLHNALQITVWRRESQANPHGNLQEKQGQDGGFLQTERQQYAEKCRPIRGLANVHGRLLSISQKTKNPARLTGLSQVKMVAGAGFEPAAFRL